VSRRRFLVTGATAGASVGAVLGTAALWSPASIPAIASDQVAQAQAQPLNPGFEYFTPFQAATVRAACARIIPTDANGPGATEAGVVYFIDRQLASDYGVTGRRYDHGPFAAGAATQGDQSGLQMRDRYRLGILGIDAYAHQAYQLGFAQLSPDQQDRVLQDMETGVPTTFDGSSIQSATTEAAPGGTEGGARQASPGGPGVGATAFFNLLRAHTIAGFFADPVHGGNRDMVGWKLIGFPGAQMSYFGAIAQYGQPWQSGYKSLAEYQGQYLPT
jgi:gluconate 2-dehydrogenase gamma chain